jgi:hypothetical protein
MKKLSQRAHGLRVLSFGLLAATLLGCSQSASEAARPPSAAADVQIQSIENNPHMPADQKEAVLARLRNQTAVADALKQTSKK